MGIKFDNAIVNNHGHSQTVEDAFRAFGNWANIHDFEFESAINQASMTLAGNDTWGNYSIIDKALQSDVVVEFELPDMADQGVACIVGWNSATTSGYAIGLDHEKNVFVGTYNGTTITNLHKRPAPLPAESASHGGKFKVGFRQLSFTTDQENVWLLFSIWNNELLLGSFAIYKGTPIDYAQKIGFAYYGTGDSIDITNIRVPQLSQFVEWNSLDPGEPPAGGLQRTIEGRYTKHMIRWNGVLRAWRSFPIPSSRTFSDNENVYARNRVYDKRQLYSHVRLLGAYTQAEYISAPLVNKVGHRFTEINNPYVMTQDECFDEAKNAVRRMIEASFTESIRTPFTPLLEAEDRITAPDGEWIINGMSWRFQPGLVDQDIQARRYGYAT